MSKGDGGVASAPERALEGRWCNDDGSVLELEVHDGRITGTFRVASDGPSYRPRRVTGTCTTRPDGTPGIVGSVVGWPYQSSVTVLTGEYDAVADELRTSWLLTPGPHPADQHALSVGGAMFRRPARSRQVARAG